MLVIAVVILFFVSFSVLFCFRFVLLCFVFFIFLFFSFCIKTYNCSLFVFNVNHQGERRKSAGNSASEN